MSITKPARKFGRIGRLSGRPSTLIRSAMKDLVKVENSPRYDIDMSDWHVKPHEWSNDTNQCMVCFAGAVMAKKLGANPKCTTDPSNFNERNALEALNEFREGYISKGLASMGIPIPYDLRYFIKIPDYDDQPKEFHGAMAFLADELERRGY